MRNTAALSGGVAGSNSPAAASVDRSTMADYQSAAKDGSRITKPATSASDEAISVLHWAAGLVVVALILLWLAGGIVFKNANL